MKTITCCLCAVLLIFTACADLSVNSSMPQEETCPLKIRFVEGGPYTKAVIPINESLIEDMNVFIFSPDKSLLRSSYFPDGNISFEEFTLSTKLKYSIYAVANWGEALECTAVGELESLIYAADELSALENGKGARILSGKLEDVSLSFKEPLTMELRRLLGKVNVKCSFSGLTSGINVTVKKVSIKNVPKEVGIFKDNVAAVVGDGAVLSGNKLSGMSYYGVDFYMFENLQGVVEGATGNKDKANLLGEQRRSVCTYIEMVCDYLSKTKRGEIVYRFYLGGADDCNVLRNTCQNVTVNFVGNASQKENSVSVDNGALVDRVTELRLYPSVISFAPGRLGKTYQCWVELLPSTAWNKTVTWSTTDKKVATVDQTGLITTVGIGECSIWAHCEDNPALDERCIVQVY